MDDYKALFQREMDRLNYLYVKANTKSKKRHMAYDLIFFEDMYNSLCNNERVVFPWSSDEILMSVRHEVACSMVQSVLDNQNFLIDLVENSFDIFLEKEFSVHSDYGKKYHKISDSLLQRSIINLFDNIDNELKFDFRDKLNNKELFINNTISGFAGLFFPLELVNKNIIFITSDEVRSVEDGRILVHELGHNFEFKNASKNGVTSIWNGVVRTMYPEVSSCFFEYAYINYLIENNLYREDAKILKRRYLNQIYYFLSYMLIIFSHRNLNIDAHFRIKLDSQEIVDYANKLLEMMNSSDEAYMVGTKINFRTPFVYGIGKLLGIYIYDFYKNNPKEFLPNFKRALLQYKSVGLDAFNSLGITEDTLIKGNVLKKTLSECK